MIEAIRKAIIHRVAVAHEQAALDRARAAQDAAVAELADIAVKRAGARSPRTVARLDARESDAWARLHMARSQMGMAHAVLRRLNGQPQHVHQQFGATSGARS